MPRELSASLLQQRAPPWGALGRGLWFAGFLASRGEPANGDRRLYCMGATLMRSNVQITAPALLCAELWLPATAVWALSQENIGVAKVRGSAPGRFVGPTGTFSRRLLPPQFICCPCITVALLPTGPQSRLFGREVSPTALFAQLECQLVVLLVQDFGFVLADFGLVGKVKEMFQI